MNDDRERIDALLRIAREHDLDALTLRVDGASYEVVCRDPTVGAPIAAHSPLAPAEQVPAPLSSAHVVSGAQYRKVAAPIVGVFYRSSAPGTEPFVNPGDRVEAGQVVCIIEAMKLMNEITSDHAGVVRRILPENGALVSLGEELVWIEA
jgi:acetyl-CoA carboxylase biotin carboxyl carrier protein